MWEILWRITDPEIGMVYGKKPKLIELGLKCDIYKTRQELDWIRIRSAHQENTSSLSLPLSAEFWAALFPLHPSPSPSLLPQ